jgi:hypothetical protein
VICCQTVGKCELSYGVHIVHPIIMQQHESRGLNICEDRQRCSLCVMLCLLICYLSNVKSISFHVKWTRSCYIVNFQYGVHIAHPIIYAAAGKSGGC